MSSRDRELPAPWRLSGLLRPLVGRHGGILCFHGIRTAGSDHAGFMHLSEDHFLSVMETVRALGRLARVEEILDRVARGKSAAGLIGITFDDAYASLAGRILDYITKEEIPVTLFVVSEAARTGRSYWWDRLDDLIPRLDRRQLGDLVEQGPAESRGKAGEFDAWKFRNAILMEWRGRIPDDFDDVLTRLERETGHRTSQRSMTYAELALALEIPCLDVGVHTRTHPLLPLLGDEEAEDEIAGCHAELRDRLERVLPILAIPFGLFDEGTAERAKRAGMSGILSLSNETLRRPGPGPIVPRFSMSSRLPVWRVGLRLSGVTKILRGRFLGRDRYPPIPS